MSKKSKNVKYMKKKRMMWPEMPRKDFLRYAAYIRELANMMGLRDWFVTFSHQPIMSGEDHVGQITCTYGQKQATIEVGYFFHTFDPEKQRKIIVHELLHAHLSAIKRHVSTKTADVANILGTPAATILYDTLYLEEEFCVDALEQAFSKFLPLP